MNLHEYPDGYDVEWIASDCDDNVGVFITAGKGAIPAQLFLPSRISIDEIGDEISMLPRITQAAALHVAVRIPDSYIELAEQGIYAYDWFDIHRSVKDRFKYDLIAEPVNPIKVGDLPPALKDAIAGIRFADISFAASPIIPNVRMYFECAVNPWD